MCRVKRSANSTTTAFILFFQKSDRRVPESTNCNESYRTLIRVIKTDLNLILTQLGVHQCSQRSPEPLQSAANAWILLTEYGAAWHDLHVGFPSLLPQLLYSFRYSNRFQGIYLVLFVCQNQHNRLVLLLFLQLKRTDGRI